jgi:basic membrane protein A and related proteins
MTSFKRLAMLLLVLVLAVSATACGIAPAGGTKDALIVGFIYVGPIGDGGYTFAHNEGRLYLEKELGSKVKTIYRESVLENPQDIEKAMNDMIAQGAKAIFATSFGYMESVDKVAKENPNVKFFHCSGYLSNTTNFVNYFGRIEQARYLAGIVAGMKTKSGKLGYVGAFSIPEVVRGINAYTLGAQSVNPAVVVKVRWTHTWYDPAKEKEAAVSLLDEGCDVIAQHQDTTSAQVAAEEKGAFAIGYNTDSAKAAPKAYLTAPIWNWGPYYAAQVKAILNNTWKAENYWGGMKDGIVALAPLTSLVPAGAKAKIDELSAKIKDGSFNIFSGPIMDQDGKEKIAAGSAVDDAGQLSMDWFVKGVEGTIEKN